MLRLWLPALLWLAVIAWQSVALSMSETSRFILPLLHVLLPSGTPAQILFLHVLLRKAGHFVAYSILGLLLYRAWWGTLLWQASRIASPSATPGWKTTLTVWSARAAALALTGTILVASLDEFQQSIRNNRTGTIADVLLDSAGGWFIQMLLLAISRRRIRYSPSITRSERSRVSASSRQ
ncbi:MAG: VanZ family protein [Candidatus Korobacteraceae bacterium]